MGPQRAQCDEGHLMMQATKRMNQHLLAMMLAGAALLAPGVSRADQSLSVQVNGGVVQVGSGTATFSPTSRNVTWNLQTRGYKLTSQSINFGSYAASFTCVAASDGSSVTCTLDSGTKAASGNYTVSAQANSGSAPTDSSPSVWTVSE